MPRTRFTPAAHITCCAHRLNEAILEEIASLNRSLPHPHGDMAVRSPGHSPGGSKASALSAGKASALSAGKASALSSSRASGYGLRRDFFVYFSDVDELLDADTLTNHSYRMPGCMGVRQKVFMYNERCYMRGTR
jgi:hypothetical protein